MARPHPELFGPSSVERNVDQTKAAAEACMTGQAGTMSPGTIRALDRYAVDNLGHGIPREVLTVLEQHAAHQHGHADTGEPEDVPDTADPEPEAAVY
ncbi:MAG: hypothetical protein WD603_03185 [Patescibacteria group bacterium]